MRYEQPATLPRRSAARRDPGARWIAAARICSSACATEAAPTALISLRRVRGLAGIVDSGALRIGALTPSPTWRRAWSSARACRRWPRRRTPSRVQIRNAARSAELCNASPCADLAPALLVTRRLPRRGTAGAASFDRGAVHRPGRTRSGRGDPGRDQPPAAAPHAGRLREAGRVAMDCRSPASRSRSCSRGRMGSVRSPPGRWRRRRSLRTVEALLEGKPPSMAGSPEARTAAAAEIQPICDVRASDDFGATWSARCSRAPLAPRGSRHEADLSFVVNASRPPSRPPATTA